MSNNWNYGGAIDRVGIKPGEIWSLGKSKVMVNDIFTGIPDFMKEADLMFVDPPWNIGNLNSFYTKADQPPDKDDFQKFYKCLFRHISDIMPKTCYLEIGKEYLAEFISELKKLYPYVTVYNSTYYHKKENFCYVIRGSFQYKKPKLDNMDEEDIIAWICENETYDCIGDCCIGRGLVAIGAHKAGKRFVGCELNPKRLAVLIERLPGEWTRKGYAVESDSERLANYVRESGLTTKKFAELLGIKAVTLRNLTSGINPISKNNLSKAKMIYDIIFQAIQQIKDKNDSSV